MNETLQAVRAQHEKIRFQNLKTHIQKFKCAIEKRISKIEDLIQVSATGLRGRGEYNDPMVGAPEESKT